MENLRGNLKKKPFAFSEKFELIGPSWSVPYSKMKLPVFQESILRQVEKETSLITQALKTNQFPELTNIFHMANMLLNSSASNDYYEKIGAEAIGFTWKEKKHGPDGLLNGEGVEVKPTKGSAGEGKVGVINDDTPMKLLKDHESCQWLVALKVSKQEPKILWAIVAPFHYWEPERYKGIVKRLNLINDPTWTWKEEYPQKIDERNQCLQDLVKKHKKDTYVRSNTLKLDVLETIPRSEFSIWIHPDVPKKSLPKVLKNLL